MCLFGGGGGKFAAPPGMKPRVETNTTLASAKEIVDPDKTADVSYASSKKKAGPAAAKKEGAAGLKIPLNVETAAAKTGGLNV